jgi:hypothetical protein
MYSIVSVCYGRYKVRDFQDNRAKVIFVFIGSVFEINDRGDPLRWPRDILYPLKLALTSPTNGGRSVGIVRWRTKTPELVPSSVSV